jgi:large subunit ribosomal protein L18
MRIRKIIHGTDQRPRMSIFRSNKEIYVQLINDKEGKTILAASSLEKDLRDAKVSGIDQAKKVGALIAQRALEAGIKEVVFDRGGYLYHGRVKSIADSAREAGLKI